MVIARGGSPTIEPRPRYTGSSETQQRRQQQQQQYLTVHGTLDNAKAGLYPVSPDQDGSTTKRDVVASFRERERIAALPTYSSVPGEIHLNDQRRRDIETELLGAPHPSSSNVPTILPAPVPATSLLRGHPAAQQQSGHRGHMVSMGDMGAYRDLAQAKQEAFQQQQQQQQQQQHQQQQPPPPAPPAGPPPATAVAVEKEEAKSEIQLMRKKLEMLKRKNAAMMYSHEDVKEDTAPPAPPAPPASTATSVAPRSGPSNALAEKIARIKAKATEDLEQMWTTETQQAKSVPLPTDHGVNNNTAKKNAAGGAGAALTTPAPNISYTPSLSEMLRRKSTKFDGSQHYQAADFQ